MNIKSEKLRLMRLISRRVRGFQPHKCLRLKRKQQKRNLKFALKPTLLKKPLNVTDPKLVAFLIKQIKLKVKNILNGLDLLFRHERKFYFNHAKKKFLSIKRSILPVLVKHNMPFAKGKREKERLACFAEGEERLFACGEARGALKAQKKHVAGVPYTNQQRKDRGFVYCKSGVRIIKRAPRFHLLKKYTFLANRTSGLTNKAGWYLIYNQKTNQFYLGAGNTLALRKADYNRNFKNYFKTGSGNIYASFKTSIDKFKCKTKDFFFIPLYYFVAVGDARDNSVQLDPASARESQKAQIKTFARDKLLNLL